jgi:N-acetyl-gamma-glutamyl-phosphate reductase
MHKIKVGVIGATSLTAHVLLELLCRHPEVDLSLLISETQPGTPAARYYRFLRGHYDGVFKAYDQTEMLEQTDLVFIAKQHGEFLSQTQALFTQARKVNPLFKIIDLSADFRLKNPEDYRTWYKFDHTGAALLSLSAYGLPELHRAEIKQASLVANPGCYPTTTILGAAPFLHRRLVHARGIIVDAYSGVSGAGMRPNERNMAITTMENIMPYKIGTHQHTPEIEQELTRAATEPVTIAFVPHVAPFRFGMCATIYLKPFAALPPKDALAMLQSFYRDEPFVRVLEAGEYPEVKHVVGTNWCEIGYAFDERTSTAIVMTAIDNAVKGASGQAIQNMNILYGWNETTGLR